MPAGRGRLALPCFFVFCIHVGVGVAVAVAVAVDVGVRRRMPMSRCLRALQYDIDLGSLMVDGLPRVMQEEEFLNAASLSARVAELEGELGSFRRAARQSETDKKVQCPIWRMPSPSIPRRMAPYLFSYHKRPKVCS